MIYEGRDGEVAVDGFPLDLRLDLANHSPTGFSWGYDGSGPAQLALAILADCCGDEFALDNYQDFKREVIAGFGQSEPLILTKEEVEKWADRRKTG